jgi:hypothetical protein
MSSKAVAAGGTVEALPRAGRRPKEDSRADELRERLVKWSYFPPEARPSLRALAEALNTSHQLLSHYLVGLEEWERKQDFARCRVITKRHGQACTEAQQMKWHSMLRKSRGQSVRSFTKKDPRREEREARTEALINAAYAKLGLTLPKPADPMAMWTKPPEGLDTWRMMIWSE